MVIFEKRREEVIWVSEKRKWKREKFEERKRMNIKENRRRGKCKENYKNRF